MGPAGTCRSHRRAGAGSAAARLTSAAQKAFEANYRKLVEGAATTMPESEIRPAENIPDYCDIDVEERPALLSQVVVVKNWGSEPEGSELGWVSEKCY